MEVVLALGIVAVALIAVVGLIPAGLGTLSDALQRQSATALLQKVEASVRGQSQNTNALVYSLGPALRTGGSPITWRIGAGVSRSEYYVLEDGSLASSAGQAPPDGARQKLHLEIQPSPRLAQTSLPVAPVRVWASVAWPASSTWSGGGWIRSAGSADMVILEQPDEG